jgi:Tfp pilus assembly protein PilN
MKPVNLLPQNERAVKPAEGLGGSSYVVLGVLGALLLAVLTFVFTQNQVSDRSGKIEKAQSEAQQAEQRAAALGAFGSFASVKQQREESVRELAKARFDWERFMRELALVLPAGTSLLDVSASTDGSEASGASGGSAPAPAPAPSTSSSSSSSSAAPTATTPAAGPKAEITGCALSQKRVATLLVRLGALNGATDVELKESAADDSAAAGAEAPTDAGAGGNTGCPPKKFRFDVTVTFAPAEKPSAGDKPTKTPARLGGGA